jgi:S1-C subfamily serine protease
MKESVKRELLKKKNVILVYTGKKVVGGVETERVSIRVGVTQKVPLAQLAKRDVVPKRIKGMETDVFQTEEIKALVVGLEVDRKSRIRPAPGGCSYGHPQITAGTLGMVVKKDGNQYILSNNHVLANSNEANLGDQTWQPGKYDGGTQADSIAHLAAFVPIQFVDESTCPIANAIVKGFNALAGFLKRKTRLLNPVSSLVNKVDCAISRPLLDEDISQEILEIGKPVGFGEAKLGDKVKKSGRTTGVTEGDVIATDGAVNVSYGEKVAVFEDQIVTSAMSEGGDSGSAVINEKNEVAGLLFAGSSSLTIINKIANVIEALGLDKGG